MTEEIQAWRLLANPTRQKIVDLLYQESMTTTSLCQHFELSRFAVMQHLKVLEKAGIVWAEKRGRYRWNHLHLEVMRDIAQHAVNDQHPPPTAIPHRSPQLDWAEICLEFTYSVSAAHLFAALTLHLAEWWSRPADEETPPVFFEPHLGGRFYEQFAGDGLIYGTVDQFRQDRLLGLMGSMGSDTAISLIRLRLEPMAESQVRLRFEQRFIGKIDISSYEAFKQYWQQLLGTHLRHFLLA